MKLLRLVVKGLPRFNGTLDLSFYGQEAASDNRKSQLFDTGGKVHLNSTEIFVGDTASGKTSVLKAIQFVLHSMNT